MALMHVDLIGLARMRATTSHLDVAVSDTSVAALIRALAAACPALEPDILRRDPPAFVGGHGLLEAGAVIVDPAARLSGNFVTLLTLPAGG